MDYAEKKLLERLVLAVEKLAGIEAPPVSAKPPSDGKALVSVIRHGPRETPADDRGLGTGGTPPEEFWARKDNGSV